LLCFIGSFAVISAALSWLPALLTNQGFAPDAAAGSVPAWSLGGILGALAAGWLSTRAGAGGAGLVMGGLSALGLAGLAFAHSEAVLFVLLFASGLATSGFLTTLFAFASEAYPPAIRSTGLGVAEMAGRLGA